MTSEMPANSRTLEIRRTFQAPRERVWAAWTQREPLEKWMCRDVPAHHPKYTELDVRPGGRYVIEIPLAVGKYIGQGTFREVQPPEKLVFTWSWRREPEKSGEDLGGESVVTIELIDRGGATEMRFTHAGLEAGEMFDSTQTGWQGCFAVLARVLA